MIDEKLNYNPFPLGQIPVELQRPELHILKAMEYEWGDDREVIDIFEKKIAEFWGARYFVTTDSCTSAIELSLKYLLYKKRLNIGTVIKVPCRTYVSAIQVLDRIGLTYEFEDLKWSGIYQYKNTPVYDSAVMWIKGGYVGGGALQCLSFQQKKKIPTGKMGGVLCNTEEEYKTLKLMSYDGRDLKTSYTDENHIQIPFKYTMHAYATPEDCARSIFLFDKLKDNEGIYGGYENYPDVRKWIENF